MELFVEISALLVIAAIISLIMRALKQPLIIGYIITGLLVGPAFLGIVKSSDALETFSSFGIALLLFIVGLGLNPKVIKEVGKVSLLTGVGQVVFTTVIGFLIIYGLGYNAVGALYIAIALTFSSTIIILKLLTDKRDQNKLYGKISIGFLLVQDIIATLALLVASASGNGGIDLEEIIILVAKGVAVVIGVILFVNIVLKRISKFMAKSQEMLFLFAMAWGFGIASLTYLGGFSLEVGALFAGIAIASLPYSQEIALRLKPLRDFFIVLFFISLGSSLEIAGVGPIVWQAILLSLFVLIGNPIIVMIIMGVMGYTRKTSFKAGLTVAQISEFSIIFILLGQKNGQVSDEAVFLVTLVGIITIAISTYMIMYSNQLYDFLAKHLRYFFYDSKQKAEREHANSYTIVLVGYQRGGREFVKSFREMHKKFIVVDYDPEEIEALERNNIPHIYGDIQDSDLLEEIAIHRSKLVVSTITDFEANIFLIQQLETINPSAVSIVHADNIHQAEQLYAYGASYVMLPHYIGSERMGSFIKKNGFDKTEFRKFREKHLQYLGTHYT
ncbi:cation:proton antiporter [Candidatus Nomurabacteria bacterium]|nr:cation:proton antiporter [Candidatus Nomurabacteria bacterium]